MCEHYFNVNDLVIQMRNKVHKITLTSAARQFSELPLVCLFPTNTNHYHTPISQPRNQLENAFHRLAANYLLLHLGQLSKSQQLTPNQLLQGQWLSRMGHPVRTPQTGAKI